MPHHHRAADHLGHRRHAAIQIINDVTPIYTHHDRPMYTEFSPASPKYHKLHRRASLGPERRINVITRTPDTSSPVTGKHRAAVVEVDTQEELARFYQQQALVHRDQHRDARALTHRPKPKHDQFALALVPVERLERDQAIHRSKSEKRPRADKHILVAPKVVEHKQVKYMRDSDGQWLRLKRVS